MAARSHRINAGPYSILAGRDAYARLRKMLSSLRGSRVFILCDDNTARHCYPRLLEQAPSLGKAALLQVQSGESNKTISSCEELWEKLSSSGADRHSLLINLGGGMISDLGGFTASVYMRGISFIHIPTTLLAMVDASVGGKTGVDLGALKNQVGTFSFPELVLIDPAFLVTLPERELLAGYAEVIKHALIYDGPYWDKVIALEGLRGSDSLEMIMRSVRIKNGIVRRDPKEEGLRKILNFGHTIGHALESWSLANNPDPMLHGEAVAAGMVAEAWLSCRKKMISKDSLSEISSFLLHTYKLQNFNKFDGERVLEYMQHDKKNRSGRLKFSLLKGIGKAAWDVECSAALVRDALEYYRDRAGIQTRV